MAALLALLPAAGHDQLWFLLMGQRWLHGAVLYGPTLFDSNPPLIVWLSALPVFLGEHLHLPVPASGKLLVLLAEAVSALLSLHLLRRLSPGLSRTRVAWFAFAFVCIFAVIPARDLGQRDHLTAILCLPYVLAAAVNKPGSALGSSVKPSGNRTPPRNALPLQILAGLLAAVGICLKPHQALIPVAVELTRLLTPNLGPPFIPASRNTSPFASLRSLLRPEPLLLLISGFLFLLLIRRFTPTYFTLTLPTLRDTYWAIGHLTLLQLLAEASQLHILGAITLLLFLTHRPKAGAAQSTPLRPAITLLLAAAFAATAAYYLQGTGWYYQQLPAISFFAAALALQLTQSAPRVRLPGSPWLPRLAAALALVALALTTHFTGYPFTLDRSFAITSPDPTFFEHLPLGTPVAIMTTSVEDTMMPVARYQLFWAQRTNNLWTLPAILRTESPEKSKAPPPRHTIPPSRLPALEHQQHAWMLEDLTRWKPQLVLIARCQDPEVHCQELEDRHDDLLAWFARDPAFRSLWRNYHYLRTSGSYDAYIRTD